MEIASAKMGPFENIDFFFFLRFDNKIKKTKILVGLTFGPEQCPSMLT